eukprot:Platyproteum_vivax@DN13042_c0_g1_i1.p1
MAAGLLRRAGKYACWIVTLIGGWIAVSNYLVLTMESGSRRLQTFTIPSVDDNVATVSYQRFRLGQGETSNDNLPDFIPPSDTQSSHSQNKPPNVQIQGDRMEGGSANSTPQFTPPQGDRISTERDNST